MATITPAVQQRVNQVSAKLGATPEIIIRIGYFLEHDPDNASMWNTFTKFLFDFKRDEYQDWSTIGLDSLTYAEITARYFGKKLNPPPKFDQRHWFGYSTDQLEMVGCMLLATLPINVVIVAHTGEDKDELNGSFVRSLHAPGRLGKFKGLGAGYGEVYRTYVGQDEKGNRIHQLQTHSDNLWAAETQIDAPDPCWPTYEGVWENWDLTKRPRPEIHSIVYGDIGSGKSTCLASFADAGPLFVAMFDPHGKDMPYRKLGSSESDLLDDPRGFLYRDVYR